MENIQEQLEEFIEMMNNLTDNQIAFASLCIAILALFVTIVFNVITHRQYIYSLNPKLSFMLFESGHILYLSVKNTGKSEAKDICININRMENNGEQKLEMDETFKNKFMLYPEESIQGVIGIYGENMANTFLSPMIYIDLVYKKGNDQKLEKYSRTVSFTKTTDKNSEQQRVLESIGDKIESIMYSENRIANYIEGRTLFVYDRINVLPHSSLHNDMKDAMHNTKKKQTKKKEKKGDV